MGERAESRRSIPVFARSQEAGLIHCEPADGQTLRELLAQGMRPERDQLIDWGCQVLEILAEAHAEGRPHPPVGEDSVVVMPDGRIVLTRCGREQVAGDALAVQSDLDAVGSLLRRLSFASRLKSGGGVAGSNGRDPLFKVLARATFRDPAARYRNAADMAEALRQAGHAREKSPIPAAARLSSAAVMPFPAAVQPQAEVADTADRRWALLMLTVTLLLMLSVIATGWLLLEGETLPAVPGTVKSSIFVPLSIFEFH
jgi:hypothetical protein